MNWYKFILSHGVTSGSDIMPLVVYIFSNVMKWHGTHNKVDLLNLFNSLRKGDKML